jgi:hypothetical protein
MKSSQISLVQSTFDRILPISDVAAQIFYDRLFHLDPALRRLFHGDLPLQGKKLMDAISIIVGNLSRPIASSPAFAPSAAATPRTACRKSTTRPSARR